MPAPTVTSQLRAQGIDALKDRRFDAAADLLNRYLDAAPNDAEAEMALAAARSGQGKHGAALVIFERQMEKNPNSPSLHFNRGATLERLGRKDDAVKAYKLVMRLKPDHAKALQRLQALGGTAAPMLAPMVIAVDDNEKDEIPRVRRKAKGRDRWIHPAWLAGLGLHAIALIGLAALFVSAYAAGRVTGELLLANILVLAGIQTVHDARRGKKNRPASLGYVFAGFGAFALIGSTVDSLFCTIRARQVAAEWAAGEGERREKAEAAKARFDAEWEASQTRFEAHREKIQADQKKRQAEELEKAVQDVRSGNVGRISSGCVALMSVTPNDRRAEVVTVLEGLLTHPDLTVRFWAPQVLGSWGTLESIPKLERLLKDKANTIRTVTKRAIEQIKRREGAASAKGAP